MFAIRPRITPARLITAIVTEAGVAYSPYERRREMVAAGVKR
jgi:methylthioribose-1-phosphate isomerase